MTRRWTLLVSALTRLPGIGPRMAERLALHLIRHPAETDDLLHCLNEARAHIQRCSLCGDLVDVPTPSSSSCPRCQDTNRESDILCVVEDIGDLQALERSRAFHGQYHVLGGVLSALDGVGPDDLRIDALLDRVRNGRVREVVVATNPTAEGETTATYLAELLKNTGISVTRLATGLPSGSQIQYADEFTLARALEGRCPL